MSETKAKRAEKSSLLHELVVQEYVSLRNESLAAKQNQQTILQWTLATVGLIIAASLASAGALKDLDDSGRFGLMLANALMIGVVVPVVVTCAFGVWLGENHRMQRAGRYLRERERAARANRPDSVDPGDPSHLSLILWETTINSGGREGRYAKNRFGSAASCALFLGLVLLSAAASIALVFWEGGLGSNLEAWIRWTWAGLALIGMSAATAFYWRPVKSLVEES